MPTSTVAVQLNLQPVAVDICLTRLDSFPFGFVLEQDGSPIDLTGDTALLTVNTQIDGAGAQLFSIAQSNTPDAAGILTFTPSTANLDQAPADYFFDVQWTSGAEVRTVVKGKFIIGPHITP